MSTMSQKFLSGWQFVWWLILNYTTLARHFSAQKLIKNRQDVCINKYLISFKKIYISVYCEQANFYD